jgi:predicted GTPase
MADAFVITKVDRASSDAIETVRANLAALNPHARISEAVFNVAVTDEHAIEGRDVLVIEDGPTTTHGGMAHGAGWEAATRAGARPVDPRPWATGSIAAAYADYPHIGPVLPALGYGDAQLHELEETVRAVPCDVVLVASPVDLRAVITIDKPAVRVSYTPEITSGPSLDEMLAPLASRLRG